MKTLSGLESQLPKNPIARLASVIALAAICFYALLWVAYGFEYGLARHAVLKHYGGVANIYTYGPVPCGGAHPAKLESVSHGTFSIRPQSVLVPIAGSNYAITTQDGPLNSNLESGYVTPFGHVNELDNVPAGVNALDTACGAA